MATAAWLANTRSQAKASSSSGVRVKTASTPGTWSRNSRGWPASCGCPHALPIPDEPAVSPGTSLVRMPSRVAPIRPTLRMFRETRRNVARREEPYAGEGPVRLPRESLGDLGQDHVERPFLGDGAGDRLQGLRTVGL
jgi:hypothetical protein